MIPMGPISSQDLPLQDAFVANEGLWRFPTKNAMILVVTLAGRMVDPI